MPNYFSSLNANLKKNAMPSFMPCKKLSKKRCAEPLMQETELLPGPLKIICKFACMNRKGQY